MTAPLELFCKDLSLCPRGHTFRRDDKWINVWCFAEEADVCENTGERTKLPSTSRIVRL